MKKVVLTILIAIVAYGYYLYRFTPTSVSPFPYLFTKQKIDKIADANDAHVLIIGDRMGVRLNRYIPEITENTSKTLKTPLKVVNWARENEGLHRTLWKIKNLKSLPKLIIYHGASEEFFEKRFTIKDREILDHNFKVYADDRKLSLIMTFPILSKFLYKKMNYYFLSEEIKENTTEYPAPFKQAQMAMEYKLFQRELLDLISYVKDKGSIIALMTTPLNLEVDVKEVCRNSISTTISREQNHIKLLLNDGDIKSAYAKAAKLEEHTPANALTYTLLGQALLKMGRTYEAKEKLETATAFDCKTWRSSVIFNNIIRKAARSDEVLLVDFDDSVNRNLGRNITFLDDLYPQEIYYEDLIKNIEKIITTTFNL